jgi:pyridoxamine 5'-phosphate oxidase
LGQVSLEEDRLDEQESHDQAAPSVREWLRSIEVFTGRLAQFDPEAAPDEPVELFLEWLREAIAAGAPDPHSMTVSTVDEDGRPDARVLILKNVDARGWQFGAQLISPKGRQLTGRPHAALTFYWPDLGRQVRVRGAALAESAEDSAADLLARSPSARAEALLERQSSHLDSLETHATERKAALVRVEADPSLITPQWKLYTVAATEIEFWQAARDRNHKRLRYERDAEDGSWRRHLLWP